MVCCIIVNYYNIFFAFMLKLLNTGTKVDCTVSMTEEWKDVDGYKVSSIGRIRKLNGMIAKQTYNGRGYAYVGRIAVSVWVAIAFLGHVRGIGKVVDHIDNDKLNNSLNNLQVITQRENLAKNPQKNKTSRYPGVNYLPKEKKWRARITINGELLSLGSHLTEEAAYMAYLDCQNGVKA